MKKFRATLLAGVLGVMACGHDAKPNAQAQASPTPTQQPRPTSTPYSGDLSIFEYKDRDKKLQIDKVMKLLEIAPGSIVADIGAGSGWFTVRAARKVGPSGLVYAEDINPDAIKYIDDRAKKEKLTNIQTVLGVPDDPKLPPATATSGIDAVLMLKVYHEIATPIPFMVKLRASLKPGALVGVIDRNGNGSGTDHGISEPTLESEMTQAGYFKIGRYDFTKADGQDYFVIFAPLDAHWTNKR